VIVIDASSLVKYLLKEDNWLGVEEWLVKDDVYTLDHAVKEILNALWKATALLKVLPVEVALEKRRLLLEMVNNNVVTLKSQDEVIDDAFLMALKHGVTVYDALYIAYADKIKASLLTSDERQAEAAEKIGVDVIFIE